VVISEPLRNVESRIGEHPLEICLGQQSDALDVFLPATAQPDSPFFESVVGADLSGLFYRDAVLHALIVWNELAAHLADLDYVVGVRWRK